MQTVPRRTGRSILKLDPSAPARLGPLRPVILGARSIRPDASSAVDASVLAGIYGDDWQAFQQLRREWDPGDKFLPRDNLFLGKIFGPRA